MLSNHVAHDVGNLDVGLGRDLAEHQHQPGRRRSFAGDPPLGSSASTASSTASEIWSHTLSGWPSVTDSDVKRLSGELLKVVVIGPPDLDRVPRLTSWPPNEHPPIALIHHIRFRRPRN